MLAKRIIPCLDVKDGRVVKGVRFLELRDAGDPVELAVYYDREGADELVFLDITASSEGRHALIEVVRRTARSIFIPLTVGGGIDSVDFIRELLQAGADKVSLNTAVLRYPELIGKAAEYFGSQCIVVAIDARRVSGESASSPSWEVYSYGGRNPTGIDAVRWAKEAYERGAGEILLTSMDTDGTREGYDLELLERVSSEVPIPVIASGGAGEPEHLLKALTRGGAHAVLAASILHYHSFRVEEIKAYLERHGVTVRTVSGYPA